MDFQVWNEFEFILSCLPEFGPTRVLLFWEAPQCSPSESSQNELQENMKQISITEVKDFFDAHWTVREYTSERIPADKLDVILHAAQRAPTDATAQMYSFVRLLDPVR